MIGQIFGPPNSEIIFLTLFVSAHVLVVLWVFLNTRDIFHKILCDFSGAGVMQQQQTWGVMPLNTWCS